MTDAAQVRLVQSSAGATRTYAVWVGHAWIGDVWPVVSLEDRLTRWGTRNHVHPTKRVTYWKATGSSEDFDTRRDAVDDLLARRG